MLAQRSPGWICMTRCLLRLRLRWRRWHTGTSRQLFGATILIFVVDLLSLFSSYYSPGAVGQAVLPLAIVLSRIHSVGLRKIRRGLCSAYLPLPRGLLRKTFLL